MEELVAFDTNILIYVFDLDEKEKRIKAKELFDGVCKGKFRGLLSIQNLSELFYWFSRKKMDLESAEKIINDLIESRQWIIKNIDIERLKLAINLTKQNKIHFWDALICANAILGGVKIVYTENVDDFKVDLIKAVNPL